MSYFTEEALEKFNELCAEGVDFGESPVYDFARCIKRSGEIYGVSPNETCREGKPISDKRAEGRKDEGSSRLAKLRIAFRKKTGRDLTPEELKKAQGILQKLGQAAAIKKISGK
jgi:hypothetical protein